MTLDATRLNEMRMRLLCGGQRQLRDTVLDLLDILAQDARDGSLEEEPEPSDDFADGYSAGRYGTPFDADAVASMPDEARAEWFRGYRQGESVALDHAEADRPTTQETTP